MKRRTFLQGVGAGFFGAAIANALFEQEVAADEKWQPSGAKAASAKAKALIVLWMNGGPSHVDTFDPKTSSSVARFKPIPTRARGVELSQHLPQVADVANHLAIVRGMTTKEGNHDRARYLMHTGYAPNPTVIHPSIGGWVSSELGDPNAELPAFVSLGGPSAGAGFLGASHDPLVVQKGGLTPQNVEYARQIDEGRFDRRRAMLDKLEARFASDVADPKVKSRAGVYAQAVRMMRSSHLKAFDVSDESDKTKKAYGDTDFGRSCLVARRLVEAGVRVVEVTLDGWDTHQDNFGRTEKLMATLDPAMASLIKDLEQKKMLDSTMVVWMGEFGRTPTINVNDGRDHYPQAWSAALAGGGVRGGQAYGKTDDEGGKVVEKPVMVANLFATVAAQLGLDPGKTLTAPSGRPISLTENGSVIRELVA